MLFHKINTDKPSSLIRCLEETKSETEILLHSSNFVYPSSTDVWNFLFKAMLRKYK